MSTFETLGFEGDLEYYNDGGYQFHFFLMTKCSFRYEEETHDISLWLAWFVCEICGFEVGTRLDDEIVEFKSPAIQE